MPAYARLLCTSAAALVVLAIAAPPARADSSVDDYKQLVARGAELFEAGDYPAARDAFADAYELHPDTVLLFNIASTYRRERDYATALQYYRQFLKGDPDDPKLVQLARETVEQITDLLEARERAEREAEARERAEAAKPVEKVAEAEPPPPPEPKPELRVTGALRDAEPGAGWKRYGRYALIGSGLMAAGAAFELYRARSASSELDELAIGTPWGPQEQQLFEDGRARDRRGMALLIGSGALAITGAVLYYVGTRRDDRAQRLAVVPTESGAVITYGGGF